MEEEQMKQIKTLLRMIKDGSITEEDEIFLEHMLLDQLERLLWEENLSREERALLEEWERERLFQKQTRHFNADETKDGTEEQTAWSSFSRRMGFTVSETETVPELPLHRQPKRTLRRYITFGASVAAMIAILLGIFFYQNYSNPVSYYADGTTLDFRLPDDTRIVMNEGSELTLRGGFNKRQRKVKMSGEIFFDVAANPEKPFIIEHGELTTQIKGTSFTIRNYPWLDDNTITVNTGIVQVSEGRKEIATLAPGSQLSYSKTSGRYAINKVDAGAQSAWKDGRIVLRNAPEKELALRLMQQYGKYLIIKDKALGEPIRIYSEFNTETVLDDLLQSLSMAYGADYYMVQDTVVFIPMP